MITVLDFVTAPVVMAQLDVATATFVTGQAMVTAPRATSGLLLPMVATTATTTFTTVLSTDRTTLFHVTPFRPLSPGGRS